MSYQTLKIKSQYRVEVVDPLEELQLSDDVEEHIERIWRNELVNRNLFNGSLLSALAYNKDQLTGIFVPYKYFIAQLRDPSLKPILNITPVSISGMTLFEDHVIFAKRSSYVTQLPHCYELAPSGSIDNEFLEGNQINLVEQIKKELFEEVGIEPKRVKTIKFFALIYDEAVQSIDLCAEIKVLPYSLNSHSWEYSQVITIPKNELVEFTTLSEVKFVPLSLLMLEQRKLL
ncbi:MAG: hypothetical protein ACSNEK_06885 [Parachlamydiaceae bacterium]